jgi:purine/pyrimidine-nucleoside phosphorylase
MGPLEFKGVTAVAKANVYFEGKVVSHTILSPEGERKTLGLIYPGSFHFGTDAAERMEIVAGSCQVKLDGGSTWSTHQAGEQFEVPAKSGFDIEVAGGICEYVCSFLSARAACCGCGTSDHQQKPE